MEKVTAKRIRNESMNIEKYFNKEQKDVNKKTTTATKRRNISYQEPPNEELLKRNVKKVRIEETSKRNRKNTSFANPAAILVDKEKKEKDTYTHEKNKKTDESQSHFEFKNTTLWKERLRRGNGNNGGKNTIDQYIVKNKERKVKNEIIEDHKNSSEVNNFEDNDEDNDEDHDEDNDENDRKGIMTNIFYDNFNNTIHNSNINTHINVKTNINTTTTNNNNNDANITNINVNTNRLTDINTNNNNTKITNNKDEDVISKKINEIHDRWIFSGRNYPSQKTKKNCHLLNYSTSLNETCERNLKIIENKQSSHILFKNNVDQKDERKFIINKNKQIPNIFTSQNNSEIVKNMNTKLTGERKNVDDDYGRYNNYRNHNNENISEANSFYTNKKIFQFGKNIDNNNELNKNQQSNAIENKNSIANMGYPTYNGLNINKNRSLYTDSNYIDVYNDNDNSNDNNNDNDNNSSNDNDNDNDNDNSNDNDSSNDNNEIEKNEKSMDSTIYNYAERMKDHLNAIGLHIHNKENENLHPHAQKSAVSLKKYKNSIDHLYSNTEDILKNDSNFNSMFSDEFLSKILHDYYNSSSSNMSDTLKDLHYFMNMASNKNEYIQNTVNDSNNNNSVKSSMYDLGAFFPCLISNAEMNKTKTSGNRSTYNGHIELNEKEKKIKLEEEKEKEKEEQELDQKQELELEELEEEEEEQEEEEEEEEEEEQEEEQEEEEQQDGDVEEDEQGQKKKSKQKNRKNKKVTKDLYTNHGDLLINKREKRSVKDEENIEDEKENFRSVFWNINKSKYFEKYARSSLELTEKEIEILKELVEFPTPENNSYSCNDSYTINDLFSYVSMDSVNKSSNIRSSDGYEEETAPLTKYITDAKLKDFQLDLMNGFLYDKQSAYEKEILKNHKLFAHISNNYKNANVNVEKILNLFPRDFIKKYKVTKKLGQGVYGKVFNAESLEDSYLNFAIKSLRYFWPNFKFKFGLEEFACNELNIMRHIMHPNVVCLLDHFRVRTFRKDKHANNKNNRYKNLSTNNDESEEYDFSIQKTDRTEHIRFFPSDETYRKNEKYNAIISKNKVTILEMEAQLILNGIDYENSKQWEKQKKSNILKNLKQKKNKENLYSGNSYISEKGENSFLKTEDNYEGIEKNRMLMTHNEQINMEENNNNSDENNTVYNHTKSDCTSANSRDRQQENIFNTMKNEKKEMNKIKNNLIDKLQYRKFSKNYKKIENRNSEYVENWNLFLIMEKCDFALSEILEQMRNKYFRFLQGIKNQVSNLFAGKKIEVCYEHLYNYVKYVYLPSKKESGKLFYPDFPALTETQTKVVIYQMLQGINQIHKEFVIHRDIKPANTLIKNIKYLSDGLNDSKEWIIKIGDFGLSIHDKFFLPEKKDANIITLQYRPPEIMCNNDIYNYSVDIWSVGMTMCECLLGFVPVSSKFDSSVLYKILVFRGIPKQYFHDLLKDQFVGELPNFDTDRLKMLHLIFTDIYGRKLLSDEGIDLVDKFLSYDYKTRITANEALKHKWFQDVSLHLNEDLLQFYKESGTYYF